MTSPRYNYVPQRALGFYSLWFTSPSTQRENQDQSFCPTSVRIDPGEASFFFTFFFSPTRIYTSPLEMKIINMEQGVGGKGVWAERWWRMCFRRLWLTYKSRVISRTGARALGVYAEKSYTSYRVGHTFSLLAGFFLLFFKGFLREDESVIFWVYTRSESRSNYNVMMHCCCYVLWNPVTTLAFPRSLPLTLCSSLWKFNYSDGFFWVCPYRRLREITRLGIAEACTT